LLTQLIGHEMAIAGSKYEIGLLERNPTRTKPYNPNPNPTNPNPNQWH